MACVGAPGESRPGALARATVPTVPVPGPSTSDPALMIVLDRQRRLSVEDYYRMIEAGILDEDDRVELIAGVIVEMSPRGPKHARAIQRLCDPTFARVPEDQVVRCQLP